MRVGVPVAFTATGTDADGDTLTYAWDFGDGNTSTAQNPTHTFLAAATRTVKVTVSDGKGGTGEATLSVVVQANRNPTIQATTAASPSAGLAPLTVQLTGAATDPDGHTVSYSWDLDGDGTFETTTQNATATYNTPGTYTPTLRVTDPFGGASTRAVTVNVLGELDPAAKFKVLVFSRTAAFRHGSIGAGITAIKKLGTDNGFAVDAIEEPALFTDAFLNRYDAVIFLSTTGDVLNDDQQAAFERYIRSGHGYVGIHAAADTEYGWPWYGQLVGAYFRNHPNGTPTATVVTEDAVAPVHGPPAGALDARRRVVQLPVAGQPERGRRRDGLQRPQHAGREGPADDGRVDLRRGRRLRRRRRRPSDLVVPALRRRSLVVHGPRPHRRLVRRAGVPAASARRSRGRHGIQGRSDVRRRRDQHAR